MAMRLSLLLAIAVALTAASVRAQPLEAPPALPAQTEPSKPVPPAQPAPARGPGADKRGPIVEDEVLADLPPARPVPADTRIDQRRQGNRVVELTVTPAGSTRSYTIVNREGQRPLGADELSAGLSTPRFFKFDF